MKAIHTPVGRTGFGSSGDTAIACTVDGSRTHGVMVGDVIDYHGAEFRAVRASDRGDGLVRVTAVSRDVWLAMRTAEDRAMGAEVAA